MIVTITPNPAMEQVYITNEFRPNRWFRAREARRSPGGRGVNASIILSQLGYDSVAMGFIAGHTGEFIRDGLLERGVSTNFVNIKGESRINTFIRDGEDGVETALSERGPKVNEDAQSRFFWKLEHIISRASAVFMGGSLPPGIDSTFYRDVVDAARRRNIPVFVDAYGPSLSSVLEALPTVVKLDHRALNTMRNISQSALDHLIEESRKIFDEGVDWVLSSYFNRSYVFCTTKGFFMGEMELDGVLSYRSAGDALMAGMMIAREERMGIEETIRFSMACVYSTTHYPRKGLPGRAEVDAAQSRISVSKL